jgi:prephenate dehydrogenase
VTRRANVVGLGLVGGSVALALRARGWRVSGEDPDEARARLALERGVVAALGIDAAAEVSVVATPVGAVAEAARRLLGTTSGVVTDVGGVKRAVAESIPDSRFVPGHPMAGSELSGLDGADETLFEGAVWVLTPTASTADDAFSRVATLVTELGAEPVVLTPERHDELVAVVSHLPHLAAASLMGLAVGTADEHVATLRLAAGGFRDMTRVASGHPAIWLDVCRDNRDAILRALDGMLGRLGEMRDIVANGDSGRLAERLDAARAARRNLPGRVRELADVAEVRIPIPDRPGAAAEVFGLAADLAVNVANFEVAHSVEGDRGVLVVVVERSATERFRGGLIARGFRPSVHAVA